MDYEKKEKVEKVVMLVVGIVFLVAIVCVWYWALSPLPDEVVPADKTIENKAMEMGIPILDFAELNNKFVGAKGLGGAGGQGSPEMVTKTKEQFLEVLKLVKEDPNSDVIFIASVYESGYPGSGATRKYWAMSSSINVILENKEFYYNPSGYKFREGNSEEVVFEKDMETFGIAAFVATVILAIFYIVIYQWIDGRVVDLIYWTERLSWHKKSVVEG